MLACISACTSGEGVPGAPGGDLGGRRDHPADPRDPDRQGRGKLKRIYETEGAASPAGAALLSRIFVVSRVELVLLVLIIFDMVMKPGL